MNSFPLERREETFRDRVIVTISRTTHATGDPSISQKVLEIMAGILTTPIRVVNEVRTRSASA